MPHISFEHGYKIWFHGQEHSCVLSDMTVHRDLIDISSFNATYPEFIPGHSRLTFRMELYGLDREQLHSDFYHQPFLLWVSPWYQFFWVMAGSVQYRPVSGLNAPLREYTMTLSGESIGPSIHIPGTLRPLYRDIASWEMQLDADPGLAGIYADWAAEHDWPEREQQLRQTVRQQQEAARAAEEMRNAILYRIDREWLERVNGSITR